MLEGGLELEDGLEVAKKLEETGLDRSPRLINLHLLEDPHNYKD